MIVRHLYFLSDIIEGNAIRAPQRLGEEDSSTGGATKIQAMGTEEHRLST